MSEMTGVYIAMLTKNERVNLVLMHKVLQKLYPEEASYHERAIEILSNGYEFLYRELYQFVYDGGDVMSSDECVEVWETLSMFDSINRTIQELGLGYDVGLVTRFYGYDGNNEGKFLSFAEFTITKEGRFTDLPLVKDNYFNSHSPARDVYRRMLEAWKQVNVAARYPMSRSDLEAVLAAAVHPSYR